MKPWAEDGALDEARAIVERCLVREYVQLAVGIGQAPSPVYADASLPCAVTGALGPSRPGLERPTFAQHRASFGARRSAPLLWALAPMLYLCGLVSIVVWALTQ